MTTIQCSVESVSSNLTLESDYNANYKVTGIRADNWAEVSTTSNLNVSGVQTLNAAINISASAETDLPLPGTPFIDRTSTVNVRLNQQLRTKGSSRPGKAQGTITLYPSREGASLNASVTIAGKVYFSGSVDSQPMSPIVIDDPLPLGDPFELQIQASMTCDAAADSYHSDGILKVSVKFEAFDPESNETLPIFDAGPQTQDPFASGAGA